MPKWHRYDPCMNLAVLKNFIAIAEAGSIRVAADNLHIAQSALSRQVFALERELGASLLLRKARGVEPTDAGRILLRHARAAADQIISAEAEIAAMQGLQSGFIRLAVIEPFAARPLPDCIARFQERYPGIGFDVRTGNSRQIVSLVREGVVDLGIAYNTPRDSEILLRAAVRQPTIALVRAGHPLATSGRVTLADFADYPLILPPSGSPTRLLFDEAWRRVVNVPMKLALESDSVGLRLAMAERTDSVAILARLSGSANVEAGTLVELPFEDRLLSEGQLELIAAQGRMPAPATLEFERLLRSALKSEHAS